MLLYKFTYRINKNTYRFKYDINSKLYCENLAVTLKPTQYTITQNTTNRNLLLDNTPITTNQNTINLKQNNKYIVVHSDLLLAKIRYLFTKHHINYLKLIQNRLIIKEYYNLLFRYNKKNLYTLRVDRLFYYPFIKQINIEFEEIELIKPNVLIAFNKRLKALYRYFKKLNIIKQRFYLKARIKEIIYNCENILYYRFPNRIKYISNTIILCIPKRNIFNYLGLLEIHKEYKNAEKIINDTELYFNLKNMQNFDIKAYLNLTIENLFKYKIPVLQKLNKNIIKYISSIKIIKCNKPIISLIKDINTSTIIQSICISIEKIHKLLGLDIVEILNFIFCKLVDICNKNLISVDLNTLVNKDIYKASICNTVVNMRLLNFKKIMICRISLYLKELNRTFIHYNLDVYLNWQIKVLICNFDIYLKESSRVFICNSNIYLSRYKINEIYNQSPLYQLSEINAQLYILNNELIKLYNNIEYLDISNNLVLISKDLKPITFINNNYKLRLWKRFWFLCAGEQTDNLILPQNDYQYEIYPIEGISQHPIPQGKEILIGEIPLAINIMIEIINILIFLWIKFYRVFNEYTGKDAVLGIVLYIYEWLKLESSQVEQIEKGSKEHYDRCYKWLRWEAEKVILLSIKDTELNGNYYISILIEELTSYMIEHHFNIMPIFKNINKLDEWRKPEDSVKYELDKIKGIGHKTIKEYKKEQIEWE